MHIGKDRQDAEPSGTALAFDVNSGSILERLIFRNRLSILIACGIVTLLLSLSLLNLRLTASFEDTIPAQHPFVVNYRDNAQYLGNLSGNTVDIVVRANHGTILDNGYLTTLRRINDEVFLLPGVDRVFMRSLWSPDVRWVAVTNVGMNGGPVMPNSFNGSPESIQQLGVNIRNAGVVGTVVASDYKSTLIEVPLLAQDQATAKLNYAALAGQLDAIRAKYARQGVTIGITGFAMIVGNLLHGMHEILGFFAVSVLISAVILFWYTRCVRSTSLVIFCSMLAVCWQLGILPLIGYSLDPYSVLVPFLIFAIGMSHGAQKMNGVMQDIGRGRPSLVAARMTFRRLFMAGFTALCCDVVGFAVLITIQIPAIQNLATVASIGVALLIFTNLILLPVLLSFTGVTPKAAARSLAAERHADQGMAKHPAWAFLDRFTQRRYAAAAILAAIALGAGAAWVGRDLQIGDIQKGAPELRASSLYNQDDNYFVSHYATSSDVFVVMVKTPMQQCANYQTLNKMDALESELRDLPGVTSISSLADFERIMSVEFNEGSYDWYDLIPNQAALNQPIGGTPPSLVNPDCDFMPISVFLGDHRAATLTRVVDATQGFATRNNDTNTTFLMAAGNAGIAAATNLVVDRASHLMLIEVYAAVILLCMITFRTWRAVLAAILPLVLTSILAQALMVEIGIGIKVATLPVTALGVGIGVDYALYILSVTLANLRQGMALSEAYYRALLFTGRVVMLTGFTLAAAVGTWAFSPIKFQADMGELLAFMFLWNMLGALILLPALSSFLLPKSFFPKAVRHVRPYQTQIDGEHLPQRSDQVELAMGEKEIQS
jgi:predicted RND superfamily exporter protein